MHRRHRKTRKRFGDSRSLRDMVPSGTLVDPFFFLTSRKSQESDLHRKLLL